MAIKYMNRKLYTNLPLTPNNEKIFHAIQAVHISKYRLCSMFFFTVDFTVWGQFYLFVRALMNNYIKILIHYGF